MKSPAEVKDAWIAALRSDRFTQGEGRLVTLDDNNNPSHCCLGVLCELYIEDGGELRVENANYQRRFNGETHYPPTEVVEWAGMAKNDGEFVDKDQDRHCLDGLNDGGLSFSKIADTLENYEDQIFV